MQNMINYVIMTIDIKKYKINLINTRDYQKVI